MTVLNDAPGRTRVPESAMVPLSVALFAAMFAQFYWPTLRSGFRFLSGDSGDGALIAFVHEHVFQAMLGHASLFNPAFYYPTPGVLGYTDPFLLNQIFYAPLRLLGVSSLLAGQLTFMLLALMGGVAFTILLSRYLQVRLWLAVSAAAIFVFQHSLYMKMVHPQHYAIYFLPVIGCLVLGAIEARGALLRSAALAFVAGLLYGLCFATGYYMAWLSGLFLLVALPVFLLLDRSALIEFVRADARRGVVVLVAAAAGFGLAASLVIAIYLPALAALRGLSTNTFLASAATFRDILNVSSTHLLWGAALTHIIPLDRLQATELSLAVTPLLVLVTLVGTALVLRISPRSRSRYETMAVALAVAILVGYAALYLLTISFQGKWSLFLLLQKFLPGAIGIRTGFRSQVVSGMFIAVGFAIVAESYLRRREGAVSSAARAARVLVVAGLAGVLALEQVDTSVLARLDRVEETRQLMMTPPPLPECRAFAIYNDGSKQLQAIQVDAMRISQRFGLPTVSGYSGGTPPDWNLGNVWEPTYLARVRDWSDRHGISGTVCWYDATTKTWRVVPR